MTFDFDETEDNHEYRKTLEQIYKDKGVQYLYNMLKEVDEESARQYIIIMLKK